MQKKASIPRGVQRNAPRLSPPATASGGSAVGGTGGNRRGSERFVPRVGAWEDRMKRGPPGMEKAYLASDGVSGVPSSSSLPPVTSTKRSSIWSIPLGIRRDARSQSNSSSPQGGAGGLGEKEGEENDDEEDGGERKSFENTERQGGGDGDGDGGLGGDGVGEDGDRSRGGGGDMMNKQSLTVAGSARRKPYFLQRSSNISEREIGHLLHEDSYGGGRRGGRGGGEEEDDEEGVVASRRSKDYRPSHTRRAGEEEQELEEEEDDEGGDDPPIQELANRTLSVRKGFSRALRILSTEVSSCRKNSKAMNIDMQLQHLLNIHSTHLREADESIQELDRKITVLFPLVNEAIDLAEKPRPKVEPSQEVKEAGRASQGVKAQSPKKTAPTSPEQKFTGQVRVKKPSVWAAKMKRRAR
ncbi:hypothetical protein CSUI_009464 [Cystoisospora suis]|uniref:Uncharacterized protein n=1 Tax=Cystoisospora suis TaxID=483139 RepID=A0A2C6K3D3_9APIC|nr:hypothetical protein CSUI_009464 [Cystoisospora suis]